MDPYKSALHILPVVFEKYQLQAPRVIDIGCGNGEWLQAAQKLGAQMVTGYDYQPAKFLTSHQFQLRDFTQGFPGRGDVGGDFDLAICVEVAEHLDAQYADGLVECLTSMAPLVLFSGAFPGQGPYGPGNHVNEQLIEYWIDKFRARGFTYRDDIRPDLWGDPQAIAAIDPWYTPNLAIFSRRHPRLYNEFTLVSRTLLGKLSEARQ